MANLGSYYINGPTLATATGVYTDVNLRFCAPNGFYSDGDVVREQLNCTLLPASKCDGCVCPCPINITSPIQQGGYSLGVGLGTGTGAVIVTFSPGVVPCGIRAEYDGVRYNELSSPLDGYHSATGTKITYLGSNAPSCITPLPVTGIIDSYKYDYSDCSTPAFVGPDGNMSGDIDSGQESLSAGDPLGCVMVIPKINPTPSNLDLTLISPCATSQFTVDVACPVALTPFSGGLRGPGPPGAGECTGLLPETFYNAPVGAGLPGAPALYDWIFTDPNGQFPVTGVQWIEITGSNWIEVANGVVVDFQACIP
jgi:hypothetical protein